MAELSKVPARTSAASIWTLRLAGAQEDANPSLWAPQTRSPEYGWQGLVRLTWRRKLAFFGVLAAIFAPAAASIHAIKPSYRAVAWLSIGESAEGAAGQAPNALELMSETAILRSPELMRELAERFETGEAIEEAAGRLQEEVQIGWAADNLIAIEYADEDPERAAAVVNALADIYVAKRSRDPSAAEDDKRPSQVSVIDRATPPASPADRHQGALLLLSFLAAAGAGLAAVRSYDERHRPAARVADLANAAGAPVLTMIEETQSHVS